MVALRSDEVRGRARPSHPGNRARPRLLSADRRPDELREDAEGEPNGDRPVFLSGLKNWLEASEDLPTTGSLLYGGQ
ncbi:MAG TPA: hypothetical protein VN520_16265 [Streptomyces sp.]|uniref:hypothetical protein n=1 Tax=Streptomyces sp. TaxID=1931 RepID=UPI002BB688CF|nr:hypothetical protein [Streptomyces sp.]HWU07911.1 hypothetical protein [Streptomyces sp.]